VISLPAGIKVTWLFNDKEKRLFVPKDFFTPSNYQILVSALEASCGKTGK
jgi:hypothetical protein